MTILFGNASENDLDHEMYKIENQEKSLIVLLAALLLSICMAWGRQNEVVYFSHDSGFYNEPFYLVITASDNTELFYTVDGSIPTDDSIRYKEPIYIDDATTHNNTICMRDDVSTAFRKDLIKRYATIDIFPGYTSPDYLVDKCTVLRIMTRGEDNNVNYYSKTYFVGNTAKKYQNDNNISLITDPNNLFDYEKGIYINGLEFDNYLKDNSDNIYRFWRQWKANYNCRGREWEREANIQLLRGNNILLDKPVGIRIHGGVSRALLPKSFSVYSRKEYDGKETIDYNFFNNGYRAKRVVLNAGGNQPEIQLNDKMISERTKELSFATMNYYPCNLFINGEYWGFYFVSEKYDEEFIQQYYGIHKDNTVIIKNGLLEFGEDGDISLYQEMVTYIVDHDMTDSENYRQACALIDINSYIDYYAALIYIARCEDWPHNNFELWRSKETSFKKYEDGKWRWMLYDCNSSAISMYQASVDHNTLEWVLEDDAMFASLWENDIFRSQFRTRIFEIADTCFNPADIEGYVNSFQSEYEDSLMESWKRYYGSDNTMRSEFEETLADTIEFFKNRKEVVESWEELYN